MSTWLGLGLVLGLGLGLGLGFGLGLGYMAETLLPEPLSTPHEPQPEP